MQTHKHISSKDNPTFKAVRRMIESVGARKSAGLCVLEGDHLLTEWAQSHAQYTDRTRMSMQDILVRADRLQDPALAPVIAQASTVLSVEPELFKHFELVEHGQGIVALMKVQLDLLPPQIHFNCVWLDGVQDPGNVGSILRTAAAAGVEHVVLGAGCASVWSPKVMRSGQGAHFRLRLYEIPNLSSLLPICQVPVLCTGLGLASSLYETKLPAQAVWVFGAEGAGVSKALLERATQVVKIPMAAQTESLNVAASAAVCLFEQRRQHA